MKAFTFTAGLFQLLFMLTCACIAEYAPIAGRYLGIAVGRTIRYGRLARRYYDAHLRDTVDSALVALEHTTRSFVAEQLGDHCPTLKQAIATSHVRYLHIASEAPSSPVEAPIKLTRRALLAMAKEARIARYSRLSTDDLRAALGLA